MNSPAPLALGNNISARALRSLCRGLVKLCFRLRITLPVIVGELKQVFIEVAREELQRQGYETNVSRISLATGLSRQEIMRLGASDAAPDSRSATLLTKVIGNWQVLPDYSNRSKARPLTYGGESSEFFALVRSVSSNIHPGTVLFELQRCGLVDIEGDRAKLLEAVNYFSKDPERGYVLLGRSLTTLIEAVYENLLRAESPSRNFHIHTTYDNIRPEVLPEIRRWMRREGEDFHRRVREFLSAHDRDVNPAAHDSDLPGARVEFVSVGHIDAGESESPASQKRRGTRAKNS